LLAFYKKISYDYFMKKCAKCEGEMEEGILKPKGGAPTLEWGSNVNWTGVGVKNATDVTTYKCKNCGYLESYAK
jgi:hypothetical protein